MRYFFEIDICGHRIVDRRGIELPDPLAVREKAIGILVRMAKIRTANAKVSNGTLTVRDQDGLSVFSASLAIPCNGRKYELKASSWGYQVFGDPKKNIQNLLKLIRR